MKTSDLSSLVATLDITRKVVLSMEINPRSTDPARAPRHAPQSVLITGATGFLGAYLLRELLDTCEAEMLCLVRAANHADGVQRLIANLRHYALWPTEQAKAEIYSARIVPLLGDLALPQLGLRDEDFAALAESADVIFHNGGQVDFIAPYENLEAANVFGTREVLRLACTDHVKPVHFVSSLGVYFNEDYFTSTVREDSAPPSGKSQQGGYNQSKWVAEQLCLVARERGLPVAIYRPARITGDSRTGIGNLGDFFSSWFKGCAQLGTLPYVAQDSFDMTPVDYVGRAIVAFALGAVESAADANGNFHFSNPVRLSIPAASAALEQRGIHLRKASYMEWRAALQNAAAQGLDNALASFATLYPEVQDSREPSFDCRATEQAAAAIGLHCPAGDSDLFMRYLDYMLARNFLPSQTQQETKQEAKQASA